MAPPHEDASVHAFLQGDPAQQLAWLRARGLPDATLLALHNACAQACFFCAGPGTVGVPRSEFTSGQTARAHLAARPAPVSRLLIGGNEPTLHPDFDALLALARPAGFASIELMTNGRDLAAQAAAWAVAGVSEVVVPLYAANAELHDNVCGAPVFDAVVAGLEAAHSAGIRVRVHSLLLQRTLSGLEELAALVRQRYGTRLGVGLLRDKGSFDFVGEAPSFAEAVDVLARIPDAVRPFGIGTPACLPTVQETPPLLAELYFRTQTKAFGAACEKCSLRPSCSGVVAAYTHEVRAP